MKANKPVKESGAQIQLTGQVVQKGFAQGSKSEHEGIYLETDSGAYQLRRLGGNPFSDPELQKLVGTKITATGVITQSLFLANSVKKVS